MLVVDYKVSAEPKAMGKDSAGNWVDSSFEMKLLGYTSIAIDKE
jgi:hypothetical protein